MAVRANLPKLRCNSSFVLVIGCEAWNGSGMVAIVETHELQPNCSTPLVIGEDFNDILLSMGEDVGMHFFKD